MTLAGSQKSVGTCRKGRALKEVLGGWVRGSAPISSRDGNRLHASGFWRWLLRAALPCSAVLVSVRFVCPFCSAGRNQVALKMGKGGLAQVLFGKRLVAVSCCPCHKRNQSIALSNSVPLLQGRAMAWLGGSPGEW